MSLANLKRLAKENSPNRKKMIKKNMNLGEPGRKNNVKKQVI